MHTLKSKIFAALVCALVVVAMPAVADTDVPEEWVGIWELDLAVYDCETNVLLFSTTSYDTLCPGSVFDDPNPEDVIVECTGSADATSFTTHCEGSEEVSPGCTANFVYDASGTRNGDSYTSIATTTISFVGDCGGIPESCQRTEITGTRTGSAPEPCGQTPVESLTWNTVRSLYR